MKRGVALAMLCYGLWGFLPIYWKGIQAVPVDQILAHRMVWSLAFVCIFMLFKNDFTWVRGLVRHPKNLMYLSLASIVISINWFTYIGAVNSGNVVEASLGYFIAPLMSFILGVVVFKERPRSIQWLAMLLATVGVFYLTWNYGRVPWIALGLASTFALYGVFKKNVQVQPMQGMLVETAIVFIPALIYIFYCQAQGVGSFGNVSLTTDLLLVFAGIATLIPLYLFAGAAQKLPLSVLGIFQYLAPAIQLFLGVFMFQEKFTLSDFMGYLIVWAALIIFSGETLWVSFMRRPKI